MIGQPRVPALELRAVRKAYRRPDGRQEQVLDTETLVLAPGEQMALVGASGSGKTTLLHAIAGIVEVDAGTIAVSGTEITALPEAARDRFRARTVGIVFQTFNLLQGLSALENVELPMAFGPGRERGRAERLLAGVGLAHRLHHRPRELSSGQQQRVAVARALANQPALVLADEPTGSLDPTAATAAIDLLCDLCRRTAAALLMVSHDPAALGRFARVERLDVLNRAAADGGGHA